MRDIARSTNRWLEILSAPIRVLVTWDQRTVILHNTIPYRSIHEHTGALELLGCQVRAIAKNVANPFIVDVARPMRPIEIGQRELHEQVAQWCRI